MADRPIAVGQLIAARIDAFVGTAQPETAEERRARLERKWLRRRRQHEERFGISPRRVQAAVESLDDTPEKTPPHPVALAEDVAARVVDGLREQLPPVAAKPVPPAPTAAEPEWITARRAKALGLLSRRAFIDAASAGKFPSRRGPNGGGAFVARREDVERYVDALSIRPKPKPARLATSKPISKREELDAAIEAELAQGLYVVRGGKK